MIYPEDFIDKIILGDCLEVMKEIPSRSIDGLVTDPPYGFGRFKGDEKDKFMNTIQEAFIEVKRILKPNHWAFVFSGTGAIADLINAADMNFQRMLWMYKPPDCTYPYRGWLLKSEAILLFTNGNEKPFPLIERKPYSHDCYVVNRIGKEIGEDGCPAVKPIRVVRDLVSRFSGVILDPFLGCGTTALACKQLMIRDNTIPRHYVGIEINPRDLRMANSRIREELRQKRL